MAENQTINQPHTINLRTTVVISDGDWTMNFGTEDRSDIEADVRVWARNILTEALASNGVRGLVR